MTDVTTIEDLMPHLEGVTTARGLGAAVIRLVPRGQRRRLALEARDRLGLGWTDRTVLHWLSPSYHSEVRAEANRENSRRWRAANGEHHRETNRQWYEANGERSRKASRQWRAENRERHYETKAKWRARNPERVQEAKAKWKAENPDYFSKYDKKRRVEDPVFGLVHRARTRIRNALNAAIGTPSKAGRTLELLGCTADEYRLYLEGLFEDGMGWENRGEWHVDHVRPLASFDLRDPDQQCAAFHFSNTKPVWAKDNASKGSLWRGERHRF